MAPYPSIPPLLQVESVDGAFFYRIFVYFIIATLPTLLCPRPHTPHSASACHFNSFSAGQSHPYFKDILDLFNDPTKRAVVLVAFGSVIEFGVGNKDAEGVEKRLLAVVHTFYLTLT